MPDPIIESIDSLECLPLFPAYHPPNETPTFRKHNLIYGFNGCGKTTLSRVFASLGSGTPHEDWPANGAFAVTLSDGTKLAPRYGDSALGERLFVFNTDFMSEHFRWKEGEAKPIFYLSKEQKDLSVYIEAKLGRRALMEARLQRVGTIRSNFVTAFSQHKTDRARLISDQLGLGRRYNATSLDADYRSYSHDDNDLLSDEDVRIHGDILRQQEPLPKRASINVQMHDMCTVLRDAHRLLATTLGAISIEALRDHGDMLPWVKAGLAYHKDHSLYSCLLCGNPLTVQRSQALESAIDDRYDNLISELAANRQAAQTLHDFLADAKPALPSRNDIAKEHQAAFGTTADELRSIISEGQHFMRQALELLDKKRDSPTSSITTESLPDESRAKQWMEAWREKVETLNGIIVAHNQIHDDFKTNQDTSRRKLKNHYLAQGHETYRTLESNVAKAERVHRRIEAQCKALDSDVSQLKQQMRQHGPAAKRLNEMISKYIGHKELEVATNDEGYEIRRHGKVATAPPSEGEKAAIVLCYFLVLLEADGRRRESLIVVLDDPVSSLDTRSMNYACSLIKSLGNVGQLIVLTHNLHVMNELKKWMRDRTAKEMERRGKDKDNATATLLFIDTVQPNDADSRRSYLVELPKYLRDYESEYHYLFHMVLRFASSDQDRTNYFFVMPNVLRKVLEIFLAFKRPGPDGLSSKIDWLARSAQDIGIDELRIRALERLAHTESHGDSIDDLVTSSSMTVEEAHEAAVVLLELIEKMDPEHKKRMLKQCRRSD